jgi:RHS repeat-associated protein
VLIADVGETQTAVLFGLDLILQDDGAEVRTMLGDGLGSGRTEMVAGAIETITTYEPYGKVLAQTGTSGTEYGYTGERFDEATGLVYLRARYYNPNLKIFMSRDPFQGWARFPASQHPYSYAYNNPVNLTDPGGENPAALAGCWILPWSCPMVALGVVVIALVAVSVIAISKLINDYYCPIPVSITLTGSQTTTQDDVQAGEAAKTQTQPDAQPTGTVVPPDRDDPFAPKILVVGDGNFSYSMSLSLNNPSWKITGTSYDGTSNNPFPIPSPGFSNLSLYKNVDATTLGSDWVTAGKQYDAVVFNRPRADAPLWPKTPHNTLVDEVLQSALNVLKPGGQMRFSASGGGRLPGIFKH